MAESADVLPEIRKLKKEKEKIERELYGLKLAVFNLQAKGNKLAKSETTLPAVTVEKINALRKQIDLIKQEWNNLNNRINEIDQLLANDPSKKIKEFEKEIELNNKRIEKLKTERRAAGNDKNKLKQIDEKIKSIEAANSQLEDKIEQLKKEIRRWENNKQELEDEKEKLNGDKKRNEEKKRNLEKELTGLINNDNSDSEETNEEKTKKEKDLRDKLKEKETIVKTHDELIKEYFGDKTLEQLTAGKNDALPILLYPVKVETKFRDVGNNNKELWVRIYPDEISIVTHEDDLTQKEIDEGAIYWKSFWNAKDDETKKQDAWKNLISQFGAPRSAWVAGKMEPANWNDRNTLSTADELAFPVFTTIKPDSWTRPPQSKVMPDKFVFTGFNGKNKKEIIGNLIPDPLIVGPDPLNTDDSFDTTTDVNDIKLGIEFDWTIDFEKAVQIGLGFKIPLDEPFASKGFDKIFVLGLKWTANETDGSEKTEELITDHHYSPGGFSLLQQGSATNNIDSESSAYSHNDNFDGSSYLNETAEALFIRQTSALQISDGQIAAELLGINHKLLQHIANSGKKDFAEAVAMNRALYPATLGYFSDTLMEFVFDSYEREQVRDFFVNNVTGRGILSAFRVGNQPYGILPTTDFANWKWNRQAEENNFIFLSKLHEVLNYFQSEWKLLKNSIAHIGGRGNPSDILLKVLGLHPNSVNFFQRSGFSRADAIKKKEFMTGGKDFKDIKALDKAANLILELFGELGYEKTDSNGKPKPTPHFLEIIYQHYHSKLDSENLIDQNPLSETESIKPYSEVGLNYIDWLRQCSTLTDLEKENFGDGVTKPNSLLYLMLRHGLINQIKDTTAKVYKKNNIELIRFNRPQDFYNIQADTITKWEVMHADAKLVIPAAANSKLSVADHILNKAASNSNESELANLVEVREALSILSQMKTARLERCFVEHLDSLTYRLDAWQSAMIVYRLQKNRNVLSRTNTSEVTPGIYYGAFGWLENIRPSPKKKILLGELELPAELRKNDRSILFEDPANAGYMHTPSINHANAAALLRNAYLTHADATNKELMTVNLSSARIRNGMSIIEGIRNGQSMELLLGYQFERGLHDRASQNPALDLNRYIYDFRDKFPLKMQPIPQKGTNDSEETIVVKYITNGLDLAQKPEVNPFIDALPGASDEAKEAMRNEIDKLKDSLDAVKDLLVSESTYQLALGNFERAGAAIKSISDMTVPAEIDIINSQRSDEINFTNRLGLLFEPDVNINIAGNNPWNISEISPRAHVEPSINKWLGKILGNPDNIRCKVNDKNEETNTETAFTELKLSDLKIHPVDFIYLLGNELEAGATELEQRINYSYRTANSIDDTLTVQIKFAETITHNSDIKSFSEIFPLALHLKKLLTDSRPLHGQDFHIESKDEYIDPANPQAYYHSELDGRIGSLYALFDTALTDLKNAQNDFKNLVSETNANALRLKIFNTSFFNLPNAIPYSKFGLNDAIEKSLVSQSDAIILKLETQKKTASALILKSADTSLGIGEKVQALITAGKTILGDVFNILPKFSFNNPADVSNSYTNRNAILNYSKNTMGVKMPVKNG